MHHGPNSAVHLMSKSASYTGVSTREILVVRSPFKVVKLPFSSEFMRFYESFCSSFPVVLVNLVDARSKGRK